MSINIIHFLIGIVSFLISNIFLVFFAGHSEGDRIEHSIFFDVSGGQFHLHHRLIGLLGLIVLLIVETYIIRDRMIFITILKGLAFGMMFHGLIMYTDYFQLGGR